MIKAKQTTRTVTHSCGCTEVHKLDGSDEERERKAAWFASKPCTKCWTAAKDAKRAVETERAVKLAMEKGLPKLSGSNKQLAWATCIRQQLIDQFEAQDSAKVDSLRETFERVVIANANANWFIDHRDVSLEKILREFLDKDAPVTEVA